MRNLSRVLIAAALSTLALSTLTPTTWAQDDGDSVKTAHPPYKPGRQIDDGDSVKTAQPPYKPGRQIGDDGSAESSGATQAATASDDGAQPVRSSRPPYKPGREADDE